MECAERSLDMIHLLVCSPQGVALPESVSADKKEKPRCQALSAKSTSPRIVYTGPRNSKPCSAAAALPPCGNTAFGPSEIGISANPSLKRSGTLWQINRASVFRKKGWRRMSRNTQKEWKKAANRPMFNLYQSTSDPNLWQTRLKASGGYLRRRLHAPDLASALEEAPRAAGLVGISTKERVVTLADAFTMTLRASSRGDMATRDWHRSVERFLIWLRKEHPLCVCWGLLDRRILRSYLSVYAGKSANYRRLAIQPILQTAGFMHREHGFANIGERLGVGKKLQTPPPPVYIEDVLSFCDWLRDNRPHLEAGACLQGLAGLQLLEVLRLDWSSIDFGRGLVAISGEVKNEYRSRVVPVAKRVKEALQRAKALREASTTPRNAHVVVGLHGESFDSYKEYSRQLRAALRKWNQGCEWAPKDLRNCLPTFAAMHGLQSPLWEQYIGHAPRTVTERHYVPRLASSLGGESLALDRRMDLLREKVVTPLEEAATRTCRILHVPEPRAVEEKPEVV